MKPNTPLSEKIRSAVSVKGMTKWTSAMFGAEHAQSDNTKLPNEIERQAGQKSLAKKPKKTVLSNEANVDSESALVTFKELDHNYSETMQIENVSGLSSTGTAQVAGAGAATSSTQIIAAAPVVATSAASAGSSVLSWVGGILGVGTIAATAGGGGTVVTTTETSNAVNTDTNNAANQDTSEANSDDASSDAQTQSSETQNATQPALIPQIEAVVAEEYQEEPTEEIDQEDSERVIDPKRKDEPALINTAGAPFKVEIESDRNNDGYVNFHESAYREGQPRVSVVTLVSFDNTVFKVGDVITVTDTVSGVSQNITLTQHDIDHASVRAGFPVSKEAGSQINIEASAQASDGAKVTSTDSALLDVSNLSPGRDIEDSDKMCGELNIVTDANDDGVLDAEELGEASTAKVVVTLPTDAQAGDSVTISAQVADSKPYQTVTIVLTQEAIDLGSTSAEIDVPAQGEKMVVTAQVNDVAQNHSHSMIDTAVVNTSGEETDSSQSADNTPAFIPGIIVPDELLKPFDLGAAPIGLDVIQNLVKLGSPIALDLNGDGVHVSTLEEGVQFDVMGTGVTQAVRWIDEHDGFLVFDKNQDGVITGIQELALSPESEFWTDLNKIDSNGNGSVDSSDEIFKDLAIWVDSNTNGVADQGELKSMGDFGIQSFNLNLDTIQNLAETAATTGLTQEEIQQALGNIVSYSTDDGQIHEMLSTWLDVGHDKLFDAKQNGLIDQLGQFGIDVHNIDLGLSPAFQSVYDMMMQSAIHSS